MGGIPEYLAVQVLTKIASDPRLVGRIVEELGAMPNIPSETLGGTVFWQDLANVQGWKLQKNWVFGNCRILDPEDIRRAWGGETALRKVFEVLL